MGKRKYTVRLYRAHDLDLISFMLSYEFNIMRAIYVSLKGFAANQKFIIETPPARDIVVVDLKRVYARSLILDEDHDAEVIRLADMIKPGYRNNFFKNVLRMYVCSPIAASFLSDEGNITEFTARFKVFGEARKPIKAGSVRKKVNELADSKSRELPETKERSAPITSKESLHEEKIDPDQTSSEIWNSVPNRNDESTLDESTKSLDTKAHSVESGGEMLTNMFAEMIGMT